MPCKSTGGLRAQSNYHQAWVLVWLSLTSTFLPLSRSPTSIPICHHFGLPGLQSSSSNILRPGRPSLVLHGRPRRAFGWYIVSLLPHVRQVRCARLESLTTITVGCQTSAPMFLQAASDLVCHHRGQAVPNATRPERQNPVGC